METSDEAQRRAKILTFWQKHGLAATKDAFGTGRATLYEWQRRLRGGRGKLHALEPKSRRPLRRRSLATASAVIQRICSLRTAFPHYGKEKLRVLLADEGIAVSASTIGKVITRFHLPSAPRQYVKRKHRREKKQRLPKEHQAKHPGDLVSMDTVVFQENGRKKFMITALDHATRLALARVYGTHSSRQAKDLLHRMQLALGLPIHAVLTDNGSEFEAHYDQACRDLSIIHFWTYPNSPKMNAHTERFNRTIQEEARYPPFFAPLEEWNAWIGHYLLEYNCYRPHWALDYRRPMDEYLSCLSLSPEKSRM
ncbi:MAG: DDE-type integrase/transposase/recombinase [Candidatus Peregrinibacteria bacterium]